MPNRSRISIRWVFVLVVHLTIIPIYCLATVPESTEIGEDRAVIHGLVPQWATAETDEGPLAKPLLLKHLTLFLSRSAEREAAFQKLLVEQQRPASPLFHRWYSAYQIGSQFGADKNQLTSVINWLNQNGLTVMRVSNSRAFVEFSGDTRALGSTFHVNFHRFAVKGMHPISIDVDPTIPKRLVSMVASISGLSTDLHTPALHYGAAGSSATECTGATCKHWITPNDFATIYDITPVYAEGITGAGHVIGVIDEAKVYAPDISAFNTLTKSAVPEPAVTVPPNGTDPGPPLSSPPPGCSGNNQPASCSYLDLQGEATLDIERAGSVAPGAFLQLLVSAEADGDSGHLIATEYAVDGEPASQPDILTISFYNCESEGEAGPANNSNALFEQAAAEGISVFVSAGDSDAACNEPKFAPPLPQYQFLSINDICASGSATCVGGTEFNDQQTPLLYWNPNNGLGLESAIGYIPEGAWNDPVQTVDGEAIYYVEGTGGGFSRFISHPPWQQAENTALGRAVPDLSLSSSCHDAYLGCIAAQGQSCVPDSSGIVHWAGMCGTSAAAPSMAGVMALLDQATNSSQGNPNPALYALGENSSNKVFHDASIESSGVSGCVLDSASMCNNSSPSATATTGGTLGYELEAGFDEVTGWGSVDVANLIANWKASASVTASPSTITVAAPGMAGSALLTLYGFPNSQITLSCAGLPLAAQCFFSPLSSSGTIQLTISTTGSAVAMTSDKTLGGLLAISIILTPLWIPTKHRKYFGRRQKRWIRKMLMLIAAVILTVGCGGPRETPAGTTTVFVQAIGTYVSANTQINLKIL